MDAGPYSPINRGILNNALILPFFDKSGNSLAVEGLWRICGEFVEGLWNNAGDMSKTPLPRAILQRFAMIRLRVAAPTFCRDKVRVLATRHVGGSTFFTEDRRADRMSEPT
jgi:hypothetical protein